jgi:hypothetical protein
VNVETLRRGAVLWAVTVAVWSPAARADVKACLDAAGEGQKLRDSGAYRRARERFIACAAEECPGEVRKGCVGWLGELDKLMPTVVFGASAHGEEVSDVRVTVDGEVVAERIDGKPVVLDPGEHHIRFERAGKIGVDQTTVVLAGEKDRRLTARFGPEPPPPPTPSPAAAPTAAAPAVAPGPARSHAALEPPAESQPATAYALGALGLAALAAGAVLDISGYTFLQQCKSDPSCTGSHERAEVAWRFVTGDILLGSGLLAGAAAWLLWSHEARPSTHLRALVGFDPPALGATFRLTTAF